MSRKRKTYSGDFKAKIVLELLEDLNSKWDNRSLL